ncbi:MAG: hypothetical protein ACREO0_16325 [Pseudoxanthomonas sp.]
MLTLRSLVVSAFILLMSVVAPARATGSLSFEGGGYWLEMEIGHTEAPVIASIRFHRPDDPNGIILPRKQVVVETFDTKRRVLVLRFAGSGDAGAGAAEPFTLSVNGERATLQVGAREISSQFDWSM